MSNSYSKKVQNDEVVNVFRMKHTTRFNIWNSILCDTLQTAFISYTHEVVRVTHWFERRCKDLMILTPRVRIPQRNMDASPSDDTV
jgi:hypothetical protein